MSPCAAATPKRSIPVEGGLTRAGDDALGSSLRRRLFGAAVARKSLALFSIDRGVKGGLLSKRTLVEISFPYLSQQCELCEASLDTARSCIAHLRSAHGLYKATLLCSVCGISRRNAHQIECHAAKCNNLARRLTGSVNCQMCNRSCKTKRGLSLHMRAAHAAAYSAQRRTKVAGQKTPDRRRKWSEAEVDILQRLLTDLIDNGEILAMACALLKERTKEQVRGKIRQLRASTRVIAAPSPGIVKETVIKELTAVRSIPFFHPPAIVRTCLLRALARDG